MAGLRQIVEHPSVLQGLSPHYAVLFVADHPVIAFVAMGAAVLVITGAEALYADMGHFGREPIRRAWFFAVFPALVLNYLGQAVISGAFSLSRQAIQLGLLPPLTVRQTSKSESGQIYLPGINGALFVGVLLTMFAFCSSERLATAYGVSVTGALLVDTILLLIVARVHWTWGPVKLALAAVGFGLVEATFLAANLSKVVHGGWLPLLIASVVFVVMTTWREGRSIVQQHRIEQEGPLRQFVAEVRERGVQRVPGTAVFPHPGKDTTPLALRANVDHNHVLHQGVVIVSATALNVPHVPLEERIAVDDLGDRDDGIQHLSVSFGFTDRPNLPEALEQAARAGLLERGVTDVEHASYFISRGSIRRTSAPGKPRWRKALFVTLAHNAADPAVYFGLPRDRTVTMGSDVDV